MAVEVLALELVVPAGSEAQAARTLLEKLPAARRLILTQLAAEIVAAAESATAGARMVVVPANEIGAALSALKIAGRE